MKLASQIHRYACHLATGQGLDIAIVTGGVPLRTTRRSLSGQRRYSGRDPGRLMEYLDKGNFNAQEVDILIIDEADRMLDMGFSSVVQAIAIEAKGRKQNMLFSATLEGGGVQRFAREVLNDPIEIDVEAPRSEKSQDPQWDPLSR